MNFSMMPSFLLAAEPRLRRKGMVPSPKSAKFAVS
jgi:hypothetical protein